MRYYVPMLYSSLRDTQNTHINFLLFSHQVKEHTTGFSELSKEYCELLPLYNTVVDMQNGAGYKCLECRKNVQTGTMDVCVRYKSLDCVQWL